MNTAPCPRLCPDLGPSRGPLGPSLSLHNSTFSPFPSYLSESWWGFLFTLFIHLSNV